MRYIEDIINPLSILLAIVLGEGMAHRKLQIEDFKGKTYGRWTVIGDEIIREPKKNFVLCQCSCELKTQKLTDLYALRNGRTMCCGCIQKENEKKNRENVVGNKYFMLLVLKYVEPRNQKRYVECLCDCGNICVVRLTHLKSGQIKSCGCYNKVKEIIHNKTGTKLHSLWVGMRQRCYNKENGSYKNYGGRGIEVCQEWIEHPSLFFDWCIENGYEEGLQIDRINNDGNYEPNNCRFVGRCVNAANKRLLQSNNTSGYRGVVLKNNKYLYNIKWKRKIFSYQSGFKTAKEAAIARDKVVIKNNLPHPLNFPELDTRDKK